MAIFIKLRQDAHFETSIPLLEISISIPQRFKNNSIFEELKVYKFIDMLNLQFSKFSQY